MRSGCSCDVNAHEDELIGIAMALYGINEGQRKHGKDSRIFPEDLSIMRVTQREPVRILKLIYYGQAQHLFINYRAFIHAVL